MTTFATLLEGLELGAAEGEKALVSFVGAGGKTSLMTRLAAELAEAGRRVAVTTTTRMAPYEVQETWAPLKTGGHGAPDLGAMLARTDAQDKIPFFFDSVLPDGKLKGVEVDLAEQICGVVDFLLVEADGARGASFKVPRPHEPALPPSTTHLCVVVGGDVADTPVSSELFFNLEYLGKEARIEEGKVCPPETVRGLLLRPGGYLDLATQQRKTFLLLGKVDGAERVQRVLPLARALYTPSVRRILLCSSTLSAPVVAADNASDKVAGIVLAAGRSARFGSGVQKLCQCFGGKGESILLSVVGGALESNLDSACVVLGHGAPEALAQLGLLASHKALMIIENSAYEEGIARSLREGLAAVAPWADAAMVLLGDMPFVEPPLIDRILEAYKGCCAKVCYPFVDGRHGHPVIFRKELFADLSALTGDAGARSVLMRNEEWARVVWVDEEETQADIDTPEDLVKYRRL